jgi:hypothetical protein
MSSATRTLITPAYKADWCLPEWADAVEAQTLQPDEIIIGVDACTETAQAVQAIMCDSNLPIRLLFFNPKAGCYRIRNTAAIFARSDILHLFDADDVMWPSHLRRMECGLGEYDVCMGYSLITEDGEESRTSGGTECPAQICVRRQTFLLSGGFEGWECAADSEYLQRGTQAGLRFGVPAESPTFEQRKTPNSLTRAPETNMRSQLRAKYKAETRKRAKRPKQLDRIAVAPFVELGAGDVIPEVRQPPKQESTRPRPRPRRAVVVSAVWIDRVDIEKWKARNAQLLAQTDEVYVVTNPRASLPDVTMVLYNADTFSPARAANVGIRQAIDDGNQVILKTDIDCGVMPRIYDLVEKGRAIAPVCQFLSGEGKPMPTNAGPCGTAVMHREDWQTVQGYDERMWGHGLEDGEMLDRARLRGITVDRPDGLLYHVWHAPRIGERYPRRRRENGMLWHTKGSWQSEKWGR